VKLVEVLTREGFLNILSRAGPGCTVEREAFTVVIALVIAPVYTVAFAVSIRSLVQTTADGGVVVDELIRQPGGPAARIMCPVRWAGIQ
jgi:hypothetical protein